MSEHNCHKLTWEPGQSPAPTGVGDPSRQQVQTALEEAGGMDRQTARRILEGDAQDWPHRQVNMARLSREWPETVFALDILGPPERPGVHPGSLRGTADRGRTSPEMQKTREYYRNGHMHTVFPTNEFPELNPADLKPVPRFTPGGDREGPEGTGTHPSTRLHRTPLPEGRLRCDGADCGFTDLENVHFTDGRDHEDQPEDLYYAELADQEYQMEGSGFFCSWCLEEAGLTREGRTTLLEEMERRQGAGTDPPPQGASPPQGGCAWKPCPQAPQMRIFHPSPEDVWIPLADYCGLHFGVMVFEGKAPRKWRAASLNNLPEGQIQAGEVP